MAHVRLAGPRDAADLPDGAPLLVLEAALRALQHPGGEDGPSPPPASDDAEAEEHEILDQGQPPISAPNRATDLAMDMAAVV